MPSSSCIECKEIRRDMLNLKNFIAEYFDAIFARFDTVDTRFDAQDEKMSKMLSQFRETFSADSITTNHRTKSYDDFRQEELEENAANMSPSNVLQQSAPLPVLSGDRTLASTDIVDDYVDDDADEGSISVDFNQDHLSDQNLVNNADASTSAPQENAPMCSDNLRGEHRKILTKILPTYDPPTMVQPSTSSYNNDISIKEEFFDNNGLAASLLSFLHPQDIQSSSSGVNVSATTSKAGRRRLSHKHDSEIDSLRLTISTCLNYWGDLLINQREKIVNFMLKSGSGYNFRYLAKNKAIPHVYNKFPYTSVEAFTTKLVEYGFGEFQPHSVKSRCVFRKIKYDDMNKSAKRLFDSLNICKTQYDKTFTRGLLLY